MTYEVEFKPRAIKDLQSLSQAAAQRIVEKIEAMRIDLAGDVNGSRTYRPNTACESAITGFSFEIETDKVIIYRMRHRSDAYKP